MNTWKEKFREKFVSKRKHPYLGYTKEIAYSKAEDIEAFITNALNQQREKIAEMVEAEVIGEDETAIDQIDEEELIKQELRAEQRARLREFLTKLEEEK